MLTALLNSQRVTAAAAPINQDYRCPDSGCGARVIVKRGTIRIAHFAHQPGSTCHLAGESLAHMSAKLHIAEEYRSRGFTADVEVPVSSPVENRRADVLIASPHNPLVRYAIEVQDSNIGETELWQRTRAYHAARIRPVWISLLRPDKWIASTDADGRNVVEKYSPRLHERWIERMAGDLWLYDHEAREFWRATFAEHLLWRGGADYIDVGLGEHIQIEPYQVPSERWVKVVVGGPCKLGQIRVAANPKRPVGTLIGIDIENPG
jgi:hypothetical protein